MVFGFGKKGVSAGSGPVRRPPRTEGIAYGLYIKPEHGYYVEVAPLDGDPKQIRLVDEADDGGYPARSIPLLAGRHVRLDYVPTKMKWLDRHGHAVPDFDNGLLNNVSGHAKDVIESLEPGVHQFLPVEYVDRNDTHLEHRYFFFVGHRLDTMYADNPTMALIHGKMWVPVSDLTGRGEEPPAGKDTTIPARLIVDSLKVGQAHIWSDKHLSGSIFASEAMIKAIQEAGLTGVKPTPAATV